TGTLNSPRTFGHFGGSGTMMWVDPDVDTSLVALTNRRFETWADVARVEWPALSDAVVGWATD
ncbi:MAG: serine hydrolase, partial [Actinomycetota bacterium]|nr:serine hydrolase [Actinomycetota bacterium]MDA3012455.1 serine hydrolase [Actinomycetota bacterium]MDA3025340.1 serine hydrolase [Actinomycetota bacterium]